MNYQGNNKVLFIVDKDGKKTHALLPIEAYNALLGFKELLKNTNNVSDNELYSFHAKNVSAKGFPCGKRTSPRFVVVKGSQAALIDTVSLPQKVKDEKEKLLNNNIIVIDYEKNCFIFEKDYEFSSPSSAASLICGNVRNGLDVFVNRNGFSLKQSGYGPSGKK